MRLGVGRRDASHHQALGLVLVSKLICKYPSFILKTSWLFLESSFPSVPQFGFILSCILGENYCLFPGLTVFLLVNFGCENQEITKRLALPSSGAGWGGRAGAPGEAAGLRPDVECGRHAGGGRAPSAGVVAALTVPAAHTPAPAGGPGGQHV